MFLFCTVLVNNIIVRPQYRYSSIHKTRKTLLSIRLTFFGLNFAVSILIVILALHIMSRGWTVRRSNSGGDQIFRTYSDWLLGPPSLLYNGHRVIPGNKAAGSGVNHPHPSMAQFNLLKTAGYVMHQQV